ncbi:hypothetical protein AB1N83_013952 [Pleurotus pulmonarius]
MEHGVSIRGTSQLASSLLARRSRLWFASSRPSNIFVVSVSRSLVHVLIFSDLLLQTCSSVRRSPNTLGLTIDCPSGYGAVASRFQWLRSTKSE